VISKPDHAELGAPQSALLVIEDDDLSPVLGGTSAFVTRYDSQRQMVFSTYLGGSGTDIAYGVAVDPSGQITVVGSTSSDPFPTESAYQDSFGGGSSDAFVAWLSATGDALLFSTYLLQFAKW
jgi:Beta-propeller repeat